MDYSKQPLSFRLRKVVRYVGLYGVDRTRFKVLGQLHMRKRFKSLPPRNRDFTERQTVGMIGCGNYAFANLAYYLRKDFGRVIAAAMDTEVHRAASLSQRYGAPWYSDDADDIISDPRIRLVYIASNHASHADYAVRALEAGKSVYIEKPHVVSYEQLERLERAMRGNPGRIFLGFNRPGSRFGELILKHLAAEQGAGMYNWFVAGHAIEPDHWYFKPEEGGRVLGNLCHWTDFVLRMAPEPFPVRITPIRGAKSDSDIVVSYTFPDETIAVISFSAKGHTFEGVKEKLSAHRGNCLITMEDYERLTIEVVERRKVFRNRVRDHGHRRNITAAFRAVHSDEPYDREATIRYVVDTARLFLDTREALETDRTIVLEA